MTETNRKSNFELLRIIAMCMIILIHLASAADLSNLGLSGGFGHILGAGIVGICNIGVSCFCLISGYFGMKFSLRKFLKLEIMMIIYSLCETYILMRIFPEEMQGAALLEQLVKSFFPFISRKYWFYSCYMCVFLFSNYIQKFIDMLTKEKLEKFIGLSLLIFSLLPTIFYFEIMQDGGKGLIQMTLLYIIGRYIHLYKNDPINKPKTILLFFALWILNVISISHPVRIGSIIHSLCRDNSITNIIMAIILFYLFKDTNFYSKYINKFTANMFAVFALENSLTKVFAKFINQGIFYTSNYFLGICLLLGVILSILVICLLLGQIREVLLKKIENKLITACIDLIDNVKRLHS